MAKTKELYYKKADAESAAMDFIRLWGGWAAETSVDDKTEFNYKDQTMRNMDWGGETPAIQVYGCRNGMAGLFAWWEE